MPIINKHILTKVIGKYLYINSSIDAGSDGVNTIIFLKYSGGATSINKYTRAVAITEIPVDLKAHKNI